MIVMFVFDITNIKEQYSPPFKGLFDVTYPIRL